MLRQISWVYMFGITLPGILLTRFIPREGTRPAKDDYEAVPMMETEGRESMAVERGRTSGADV